MSESEQRSPGGGLVGKTPKKNLVLLHLGDN